MIVYTTETGGIMKTSPYWGTAEDFEEIKRTGRINISPWRDDGGEWVAVKMAALCDVRELHDFVLEPAA